MSMGMNDGVDDDDFGDDDDDEEEEEEGGLERVLVVEMVN